MFLWYYVSRWFGILSIDLGPFPTLDRFGTICCLFFIFNLFSFLSFSSSILLPVSCKISQHLQKPTPLYLFPCITINNLFFISQTGRAARKRLWYHMMPQAQDLTVCLYLNLKHGKLDYSATAAGSNNDLLTILIFWASLQYLQVEK